MWRKGAGKRGLECGRTSYSDVNISQEYDWTSYIYSDVNSSQECSQECGRTSYSDVNSSQECDCASYSNVTVHRLCYNPAKSEEQASLVSTA